MSSGLADSSVEFVPAILPARCDVTHVDRAYTSEGVLSWPQSARSGAEGWVGEAFWEEIYREDALGIVADLERWGTREPFTIYIPGEGENLGDATPTQLNGLKVSGSTGTSTATDVRFNNHASTPDTIIYQAGANDWLADGFRPGMVLTISGADEAGNNGTANRVIASVNASTITLTSDSPDLVTDASDTGVTITAAFLHQGRHLGLYTDPAVASTLLLKRGCFIGWSVSGRYQMARLYQDLTTDSNGEATAELSQWIRNAPAADSSVYTRHIPLRVKQITSPGYRLTPPTLYTVSVKFVEYPAAV